MVPRVEVFRFPNGNVACVDKATGEQMPEYQGDGALEKIFQASREGKLEIVKVWIDPITRGP